MYGHVRRLSSLSFLFVLSIVATFPGCGGPASSPPAPVEVATDFVYGTTLDGQIFGWRADATTGALTALSQRPAAQGSAFPTGLSASSDGRLLFQASGANWGSAKVVTVFRVGSSGGLVPLGKLTPAGSTAPNTMVVGEYLYVLADHPVGSHPAAGLGALRLFSTRALPQLNAVPDAGGLPG